MSKVIVNDTDVSECEHFKINRGFNCYKGYNCTDKECSDCYYKQLRRAKAENKELERKYADVLKLAKENADSNEYCLQELEQENEKLKEEITKLSDPRYQIAKVNEGYYNRMIKYSQCLKEIKEIAEEWLHTPWFCFNCRNNMDDKLKEILDKINEVIGVE